MIHNSGGLILEPTTTLQDIRQSSQHFTGHNTNTTQTISCSSKLVMSSTLSSSTTKTLLASLHLEYAKFRPFSILGLFQFSTTTSKPDDQNATVKNHSQFSELENSIYTILTIDRWESLNHMNYKLASLRQVHGRLALKFLNFFINQPGLEHNHLTHVCLLPLIALETNMEDTIMPLL
ncbi:hypothetical protein ES319_A01G092800v1 [Gossypium barbadense]|uniref:Uncharacterized protein n=1 Tax=Gossypium barbadense TaxID=3634 RepID=A0A5J5WWM4_GOSBA|nr:hypothetical protein ES319_A01G092800v1 [Gossypium barbadense]